MEIVANNITFRKRSLAQALRERQAVPLQELAQKCVAAGPDVLALDIGTGGRDGPALMEFAVAAVQEVAPVRLCLSTRDPAAMEAGLRACRQPPILNYVSLRQEELDALLPLAARYEADVILLLTDTIMPTGAREALHLAAVLVGAANEMGIPNERLIIDPGVVHATSDRGQRQAALILELLPALRTFDPPPRTTCWIHNISAGAPRRLRPALNSVFLAMLAALGLSSAFVDVLEKETMRTLRLIRVLQNQLLYADWEAELR